MSAAIGFCAMYFQRETPCASAPATGCIGSPVPTSQIVGIAKPVKPEPERSPYTITGVRNPWAIPRGHTGLGRDYTDTGRGVYGRIAPDCDFAALFVSDTVPLDKLRQMRFSKSRFRRLARRLPS